MSNAPDAASAFALTTRESSSAAHSGQAFTDPWMRRVREVDDDTLHGLVRQLVGLRRLRNGVAGVAALLGASVFGVVNVTMPLYAVLIYGTLAMMVGLPVFAIGTLSVRRLFLAEARRQGLSLSAAMLVLTRAERRARFLAPWLRTEAKVDRLLTAVRDPDTAS